jgi:hypothetical protein
VGILADDPGRAMALKAFHAKVLKEDAGVLPGELPVVREIGVSEVEENFQRVKKEVAELVKAEMKRIVGDPGLKGKVISSEG